MPGFAPHPLSPCSVVGRAALYVGFGLDVAYAARLCAQPVRPTAVPADRRRTTPPAGNESGIVTEEEARSLALALIPATDKPLTLSELENYLAGAADLLRGSIDQADFKAFIFPLMFFKRISDVYLEEYGLALADSGGDHEFAAFAENHRFAIPRSSACGRTSASGPRTSARRWSPPSGGSRRRTRTPCTASSATPRGPTRTSCPTRNCST